MIYILSSHRFLSTLVVPGVDPSPEMGFRANQKPVGYSHNIHTTIAPMSMYISCQGSCSFQHSQLDEIDAYFSLPAGCMAPSSTTREMKPLSWFLHVLWLRYTQTRYKPDTCSSIVKTENKHSSYNMLII